MATPENFDKIMRKTGKERKKHYKFKCTYSGTVADAMKCRGWVQVDEFDNDWDIFWCDLNQLRDLFSTIIKPLDDHQRIAHFRNCQEISRKNLLVKNLKRLRNKLEKAYGKIEGNKMGFLPKTMILPSEHKMFVQEFKANPDNLWIIKPAAGAQGRGIFIFKTLKDYLDWRQSFETPSELASPRVPELADQVTHTSSSHPQDPPPPGAPLFQVPQRSCNDSARSEAYVVQKYIKNPYLIGGRKFDIRFFVLVTSFNPLKAWVYREGFARFSAGQFSLEALQDVYIHLTNVAIQRTAEDYDPEKGSKWSLQSLREYLTARHGREKVQHMMNLIDYVIVRTLQSVSHSITQDKRCFEIYGFDVLIDKELYPWLLEVNASPAFTPSNEEDYRLKCALVDDTVSVLDLEERLTGFEKRVGGYDLIWNDSPVYANPADCSNAIGDEGGPKLNSYLGCDNNRVPQLKDVYRNGQFVRFTYQALSSGSTFQSEGFHDDQHAYSFNMPKYPRKIDDVRYQLPE